MRETFKSRNVKLTFSGKSNLYPYEGTSCYALLNFSVWSSLHVTQTSSRFVTRSEPKQCRNVLWRLNIKSYQKKVEISRSLRGAKMF